VGDPRSPWLLGAGAKALAKGLAILSVGESWHNHYHADPTCARHGVLRGQIDISARLIWIFEKFGWAASVRWPAPTRLNRISAVSQTSI
jgi:stearoyl-CoA desaturase (delta-9 desaturase)